ncbi:MAG: ferrochelatase [Burkholderiales bacterium]|nr:ferrochelatase [Burkholderiales bacterium]
MATERGADSAADPLSAFRHGCTAGPATGILLCNLGSPDEPTPEATRRYLAQFLSDPRVVEIPRLLWWPILHGIILNTRPKASAAKYAQVWMKGEALGAPLKVFTQRQAKLLQGMLGERGHRVQVAWAMRYGQPGIAQALDALRANGAQRLLVFNAYPQYCAATVASNLDVVSAWMQQQRALPELRFITHYHDDEAYLRALARSVKAHWQREGRGRVLLMSFHGMPERTLKLGDPYHCECHKTARLLAERLGLQAHEWRVSFQSRFGKAKWLEPSTEQVLQELGQQKLDALDLICPGFSADCLETLEEIAMEGRETFQHAGGGQYRYIPCLNDSSEGMQALTEIAERHLAGWPTQAAALSADELTLQAARARALGAKA